MTTIWHLAEPADWEAARAAGRYERSTRGTSLDEVGYVHCSSPEQLPDVVAAVYADVTADVLVLELDRARLEAAGSPVREEPGDAEDPESELYPHVYGPVPVSAVVRILSARVDRGRLTVEGGEH